MGDAIKFLSLLPQLLRQTNSNLTEKNTPMPWEDAESRIEFAKQSILRVGSFLKEMSGKEEDDQRYLYEREWRIVSGIFGRLGNPFRKLTDEEKNELIAKRPHWAKPLKSSDPKITAQFSNEPMINSFWFFDGIPGREKISEKIEVILVPSESYKSKVEDYIRKNKNRFKANGPSIRLVGV